MINKYYMSDGDRKLSSHFMLHEFQSRNGCDIVKVDDELIELLEKIYSNFDCSSAVINDGYREPGAYCRSIGGMDYDAHAAGMAADVTFFDRNGAVIPTPIIGAYCQDKGVGGIGYITNTSIHLDNRQNGGYKNTHWWGNEITGENISDWYSRFNVSVNDVYDYYGDNTNNADDTDDAEQDDNTESSNSIYDIDGGNVMNKSREQLIYEVNRLALTLLGREIGNAADYAELLANGTYSWYDVSSELQECEEGVKHWIRTELYLNILHREPQDSEVNWWYSVYATTPINKAEMVKGFTDDYEAFKQEYLA